MQETLRNFINNNLFDASLGLLDRFGLKYTLGARTALSASGLFKTDDGNHLSKATSEALALVSNVFFVALIDERTFTANPKTIELNEAVEKAGDEKYNGMFIFAVDIKDGAKTTRSSLATLTRAFNKLAVDKPVVLLIRQNSHLSLSICERSAYSRSQQYRGGEKMGKVSLLRNVDCQNTHEGHIRILKELECSGITSFDKLYEKWQKVFSTSILTKQFYTDLFDWFQWAINPETRVSFPGNVNTQDDDRENIETHIIRLITRLMFVWFIKEKKLVPDKIFSPEYVAKILKDFDPKSPTQCNYYQAILQNLFFGTLNRPIIEDNEKRQFAKASSKDSANLYRYSELFSIPEQEVIDLFSTVPFLNCGLFECLDKTKTLDGVEHRFYNDGFSRNERRFKDGTFMYRAVVPNILFFDKERGILSIFNRYVFTIEENTPQDVQVALDPELLGKVFENLLGYINPESHDTVTRNETGSFYTPREIVQYMVNESLVAHLKQTVGEELETQYRQLLDFTTENIVLTDEQKNKILHSLFTCKILDPACGSGAFPMGMLQQMVHILQQVDPDNTLWREVLLNMAVDESRRAFGIVNEEERKKKLLEIEETFNNGLNSPDYTRKLYIIESCIYGVDIQPIAMLISRLRFFITLICEQTDIQRDKPELNFGIKTLPNLESKFVAANSLISADIHLYNKDWTQDKKLTCLKNDLIAIRRRHFYTRKRSEKIHLLQEDQDKRKQIHQHINRLVGEPNVEKILTLQQQIADNEKLLKRYQGEDWVEEAIQNNLFSEPQIVRVDRNKRERDKIKNNIRVCKQDIEREKNKSIPQGFEAAVLQVTAWNPYDQNSVSPFLDIEWMFGITDGFDIVIGNPPYRRLQENGGELANLYAPCGYDTFDRNGDIYCLFYERGYQLLKKSGILCYITSNKWMRAGYGEKPRDFFAKKTNPILLIDFAGVKIFESATVDTNILLYVKADYQHKTICAVTNKQNKDSIKNLSDFVQQQNLIFDFGTSDSWVILSPIEQSIKRKIEAVGTPLKDWDINIYRGVLTGCNEAFIISSEKRDEILANCKTEDERQRTAELIRPILRGRDIKRYGYVDNGLYLINTHNGVKGRIPRIEIEDYPAVKAHLDQYWDRIAVRADQGDTPYNLRNCAYLEDFFKPKIAWASVGATEYSLIPEDFVLLDTNYFLISENYLELLAFLNSKLIVWWINTEDTQLGNGGAWRHYKYNLEKLCIPQDCKCLEGLVKTILQSKDYNHIESIKIINRRIYEIFNLDKTEIEFIESQQIQ